MITKTGFLLFSLLLLIIFCTTIFFKARGGLKQGSVRKLCSLLMVVLSASASFLIVTFGGDLVYDFLCGITMEEMLLTLENLLGPFDESTRLVLLSFSPEAVAYLVSIPIAVLAPFFFIIFYIVARLIFRLIYKAVDNRTYIPVTNGIAGRKIGAALGAAEGIMILVICFIPLMSVLNWVVPAVSETEPENPAAAELIDGLEDFDRSPVIMLAGVLGGDYILDELTTIGSRSNSINVEEEILCIIDLIGDISRLTDSNGTDSLENCSDENGELIISILDNLERSEFLSLLISDSIHLISNAVFSDLPDEPDKPIDKLFLSIKDFLNSSTKDTVKKDLNTAKELFIFLSDDEISSAFSTSDGNAAMNVFSKKDESGNTVIKNTTDTLKQNDRTEGIVDALNELSVSVMKDQLASSGEESSASYESVKAGLDRLASVSLGPTDEEYNASIKEILRSTFEDNAIDISDTMLENMAEETGAYIKESRANGSIPDGATVLTPAQTNEILIIYYGLYTENSLNLDS